MDLVEEFVFHADLGEGLSIGDVPVGSRIVIPVIGGWISGTQLNGTVVGPGADWAVFSGDGFARLNVRCQLQTDDGALVYVHYDGVLELNEATMAAFAGGTTDYGDHYFRTSPHFETGDDRYKWLNTTLFVSRGRLVPDAVEYEICRVS